MRTDHFHKQGATPEWSTPQPLFDRLNEEFGFTLDVAASPENRKCRRYYAKGLLDGLTASWHGEVCWMNPPYGREIREWMKKAYTESQTNGATVVCLVPARTDAAWWHDYAMKGEVRFIRGRIKFGGAIHNAPFPSAVVVFRPVLQLPWQERLDFGGPTHPDSATDDRHVIRPLELEG